MAVFTNNAMTCGSGGIDLDTTLFCGQSFSWERLPDGRFRGVASARSVCAKTTGDSLVLENCVARPFTAADEAFWRAYFALDEGQDDVLRGFCADETLGACVHYAPGARLLRQPFFDTLLSFIISQNNNIPRITGIVGRLRENFGEEIAPGVHAFPTAERLAACTPDSLACLRAGFRARYLVDAAQKVAGGAVTEEKLAALPDAEARALLTSICGVGPKVADCVLLYGLGRDGVVPMDVWMKRAMGELFPGGMPPAARGREGMAQLYVFCWAREHLGNS